MITRFAILGAVALAVGTGLWFAVERYAAMASKLDAAEARLRACNARTLDILNDKDRDDEIDAFDDDALRDFFADWMRNPGAR